MANQKFMLLRARVDDKWNDVIINTDKIVAIVPDRLIVVIAKELYGDETLKVDSGSMRRLLEL